MTSSGAQLRLRTAAQRAGFTSNVKLALPVRPPLLLDGRFYKGVATGGVLAVAARVAVKLIFHI